MDEHGKQTLPLFERDAGRHITQIRSIDPLWVQGGNHDLEEEQRDLWQYDIGQAVERAAYEHYLRFEEYLYVHFRIRDVVVEDVAGGDYVAVFERATPVLDGDVRVNAIDDVNGDRKAAVCDERSDVFVRVACVVQDPEGMPMRGLALVPSVVRLYRLDERPMFFSHPAHLVASTARRVPAVRSGLGCEELLSLVMDREPCPARWSLGSAVLDGEMLSEEFKCGAQVVEELADEYRSDGRRLIFDAKDRAPLGGMGLIAPACLLFDGVAYPVLEVRRDGQHLAEVLHCALDLPPGYEQMRRYACVVPDHKNEEPTQKTQPAKGEPIEIPVPKREDVERLLSKAGKPAPPKK